MTQSLEDTWQRVRPRRYANGGSLSERDAIPVGGFLILCVLVWVLHDVLNWVPLPSEETLTFFGTVLGLYVGRRFRP